MNSGMGIHILFIHLLGNCGKLTAHSCQLVSGQCSVMGLYLCLDGSLRSLKWSDPFIVYIIKIYRIGERCLTQQKLKAKMQLFSV